jgi:hypothetical protein
LEGSRGRGGLDHQVTKASHDQESASASEGSSAVPFEAFGSKEGTLVLTLLSNRSWKRWTPSRRLSLEGPIAKVPRALTWSKGKEGDAWSRRFGSV